MNETLSSSKPPIILHVAIASPLRCCFDYLAPAHLNTDQLSKGTRVRVPFRSRETIGIIVGISHSSSFALHELKTALEILDTSPLLSASVLQLLQWASDYYQYPIGEVILNAIPNLLRQGKAANIADTETYFLLSAKGKTFTLDQKRAKKQTALIDLLLHNPQGLCYEQIKAAGFTKPLIRQLLNKGLLEITIQQKPSLQLSVPVMKPFPLSSGQQAAIETIARSFNKFQTFLLNGVTGSGKTEVYLQLIEQIIQQGKQALILVPEISLTPQTLTRFQDRFATTIAVLHSGLSDRKRLEAWSMAKNGQAAIIIGTRSAIFTSVSALGIIIIDEEHDVSFKQQDGFRYHARDLAIVRGKIENIPIVLGSATPSLESVYNVQQNRYQLITLPERAGNAVHPSFKIFDIRNQTLYHGISEPLLTLIKNHLRNANQVLLFLNRRGYAPTLLCHACGWIASCHRCDARLTLHHAPRHLHCHHCDSTQAIYQQCPKCLHANLIPLGSGTERIEKALTEYFPGVGIARLDRDSTKRKGAMQNILEGIQNGAHQILIGTQILAKGHHFPNVTLVAILDADSGLFSNDFRASERIAQLLTQVAGRAGRAEKPGEVIIQTHHPDHPLLLNLIQQGYTAFSQALLLERKEASLPPHTSIALFRAEALTKETALMFLNKLREKIQNHNHQHIEIFGPIPAPMERRAGRYRAQLLLSSRYRKHLQAFLPKVLDTVSHDKQSRQIRWSLDIDPIEMF